VQNVSVGDSGKAIVDNGRSGAVGEARRLLEEMKCWSLATIDSPSAAISA
jgi:hypothetical protein